MVNKIILVFKTHFDIGFTDLADRVIENYADSMLKDVIATCKATQHMGKLQYVWTMPAWPLKIITERCSKDLKSELDQLIARGQIVWHALPFTSHTDFCSAEEYIEGLRFSRELSNIYHIPQPISAKMTDVPGHGIMLPTILSGAGIKFLHLGCNEFSNPPKLPFLFQWQSMSGERVLTMYSKGGYGTTLIPPDNWEYPVWMSLMHTQDNCGPQSVEIIEGMVKRIQKKYPEAEIVCGSMDDFYNELIKYDLSSLPVITKDLADTWIHGIGSYPAEIKKVREEREESKRLLALLAKKHLEGFEETTGEAANILDRYYEEICLFEEHTWGADVKTWLGKEHRVYRKKEFLKKKSDKSYRFMEASWQEQRDRVHKSSLALNELKVLVEGTGTAISSMFNPGNSEFTGWVTLRVLNKDLTDCGIELDHEMLPITKIDGEWACFVKNLPPFVTVPFRIVDNTISRDKLVVTREDSFVTVENHRYSLQFSESTGDIIQLYDKKLKAVLLKQHNQRSVFSYQYDRYGISDVTNYLKEYAYRFSTWGIQDYGREAYPECEHKTYRPSYQSFSIEENTIVFRYVNQESVEFYGDAEQVIVEVTLPPIGDEVFVQLKLKNKKETPYIESGSFLIPVAMSSPRYLVNKTNVVLDPATDIQEDANHVFYCLENYISAAGEENGICVVAKDTPLASLGDTGIYKYSKEYKEPTEPVIYFNLFNNMWGTNFPQWIGGDFCYRFVLFGYQKEQEVHNLERAAKIKEGIELTGNQFTSETGVLPEHMQMITARAEEGNLLVRFKDLLGEEAIRKLQMKNYSITPVDLYNRVNGITSLDEHVFPVKPYGIYSFLLSKKIL